MMHSGDEDIELYYELYSVRLDRTGPNFLQKNTKIIKKFGKFRVRSAVTKSN